MSLQRRADGRCELVRHGALVDKQKCLVHSMNTWTVRPTGIAATVQGHRWQLLAGNFGHAAAGSADRTSRTDLTSGERRPPPDAHFRVRGGAAGVGPSVG